MPQFIDGWKDHVAFVVKAAGKCYRDLRSHPRLQCAELNPTCTHGYPTDCAKLFRSNTSLPSFTGDVSHSQKRVVHCWRPPLGCQYHLMHTYARKVPIARENGSYWRCVGRRKQWERTNDGHVSSRLHRCAVCHPMAGARVRLICRLSCWVCPAYFS
jgi:hypothetical protein